MDITTDLLKNMGATFDDNLNGPGQYKLCWVLKVEMHNRSGSKIFKFRERAGNEWLFIVEDRDYYTVTRLEECFFIIAQEYFKLGRKEAKNELNSWLLED